MNRQLQVLKSELLHFSRSPLKIVALFLYVFAAIYGLQNGYGLFVKHNKEITAIKSTVDKSISEMIHFTKRLKGQEETVYGLAGLGDLYVSSAGGRNSKMGKLLGEGNTYQDAKEKFMKNDTVEGAELIFEIGDKILKEFDRKKVPLMMSLIDTIKKNKKLTIDW